MIMRFVLVALKDILANKARSFLTVLGILIGISSVTMMVSVGGSAKEFINQSISNRLGKNLMLVQPGKQSSSGGISFSVSSIFSSLSDKEYDAIKDMDSAYVQYVSRRQILTLPVSFVDVEEEALVMVVDPPFFYTLDLPLISGRYFRLNSEGSREVVIGESLAEKFFKLQDPIGRKISIRGNEFTIIGVVEDAQGSSFGGSSLEVYIQTPIYRKVFSGKEEFNAIAVAVNPQADFSVVEEKMTAVLRKARDLTPSEDADFTITTQSDIVETSNEILSIVTLFITVIAAISLVVGGVGVMNIMLVSVKERVKEIGLRKAVGATNQDIQTQILIESVLFSIIGGIFGIIIGSLGALLIESVGGLPSYIDLYAIAASLGVSSFVGIVFGLYPAIQAGKLSPIEALRSY